MLKESSKFYKEKEEKNLFSGRCGRGRGGFTIVETLVAISILVIALTGPLSIISSSLKSSYFSRDEITAAYLAQEPIEYIRNIRDQNGLREPSSATWLKEIAADPLDGDPYINAAESKNIKLGLLRRNGHFVIEQCVLNCKLKYDEVAGVYGDDNDLLPDSLFTREVYLSRAASDPDLNRELVITVIVSWSTGSIAHNVTVTEHLFNWQLESDE